MSVPKLLTRRSIFGTQAQRRYARERSAYTFAIPRVSPEDSANSLSKKLLSKEVVRRRLYSDPKPNIDAARAFQALPQQTRYHRLSSQQTLSHFRNIVARFEVEGFDKLLKTGARYPLEAGNTPPLPSELLRQGDSLLRTSNALPGWTRPALLDISGLKDADSTVLRILPPYRATLEESKQILRTFNALISRIRHHGHYVSAVLAGEGQCLAANAHSTGSLLRYAHCPDLEPQQHIVDPSHLAETMASVRRWVIEDGSTGEHQRAALSAIFATDQSATATLASQVFRSQFISLDDSWRWDYLDVLRRLHGPREVLAAWSEFQTTPRWEALVSNKSDASSMELASTLQDIVEQLIIANEPQLAWVVVHSLGWEPESVLLKTWDLLFDFPEYLTQMNDGLQAVLLRLYEERVERIEEALGVTWTGGEDGSHVLAEDGGDPQTLVEGLHVSDEDQKN